jgi:hypothetical protein
MNEFAAKKIDYPNRGSRFYVFSGRGSIASGSLDLGPANPVASPRRPWGKFAGMVTGMEWYIAAARRPTFRTRFPTALVNPGIGVESRPEFAGGAGGLALRDSRFGDTVPMYAELGRLHFDARTLKRVKNRVRTSGEQRPRIRTPDSSSVSMRQISDERLRMGQARSFHPVMAPPSFPGAAWKRENFPRPAVSSGGVELQSTVPHSPA